jgi:hypothetical protein
MTRSDQRIRGVRPSTLVTATTAPPGTVDATVKCPVRAARSREGGEVTVHDQFDVTLEDADLLGEVELTTNLIIAASETDDHLTTDEIDAILGVTPRRPAH